MDDGELSKLSRKKCFLAVNLARHSLKWLGMMRHYQMIIAALLFFTCGCRHVLLYIISTLMHNHQLTTLN